MVAYIVRIKIPFEINQANQRDELDLVEGHVALLPTVVRLVPSYLCPCAPGPIS